MKTTPQPEVKAEAKAEAKAVSRPARRMRSKGPLQHQGSRPAPRPGGDPPENQDQLAEGDARGSGGVSRPPGLPVRHNPRGPDDGTPVDSDYDRRPPHKPDGDPNPGWSSR